MSKRTGVMLCYPFEESRLKRWGEPPWIVQPKLDGIRCRAVLNEVGVTLNSSEANIIRSVPHIEREFALLARTNFKLELDGELYVHRADFSSIESVTQRTVNIHPDHERMEYHLFDIISDGVQAKRLVDLSEFISSLPSKSKIKMVPHKVVYTLTEVLQALDDYIEAGYEGIVIRRMFASYKRSRSVDMMKFKPYREDAYPIVGYKEELSIEGELKGRLGALICETDNETFSVGSGLNDEQREYWWTNRDTLVGKYVVVKYQNLTVGKKKPRFPVVVEIVSNLQEYITKYGKEYSNGK